MLPIPELADAGSDWHNHKGSFSTVLLAMCDADYRLTWVDIGGRGRSDAGLHCLSCQALLISISYTQQAVTPPVIVGGGIFPHGPHLMRPFPRQNLPDFLQVFNYR